MGEEALFQAAAEASRRAYAPYSGFQVGAAVETADGTIFTGANVENASYGLTVCAERMAIGRAVIEQGNPGLKRLVVVTPTDRATPPCGACRQVWVEFARGGEVVARTLDGSDEKRWTTEELLPAAFTPRSLDDD